MKEYSLSPVCKQAKHWKENLPNELHTYQIQRRRGTYRQEQQTLVSKVQDKIKEWMRVLLFIVFE